MFKLFIWMVCLPLRLLFTTKVTAPLMGFRASGQIAKALVYFPWKGINAVRSYVVPANPNTTHQQTQRGYLGDAVDEFHGALYTADDLTAWNRLAGIAAKIMSGFNRMVKEFVDQAILGSTWERIHNAVTSNVFADMFRVTVDKVAAGNAPTLRWGTSRTFMPNTVAMTDNADGTWFGDCTPLSAETLYYFTVDVGASGTDWGRIGIYQQRTTA